MRNISSLPFLHFRLGNMSYFYGVQHRLSNMCLPVLTCLLLFQPIPLPVWNLWSSTLDPVSHIRWNQKIKVQKCLLVDNYFLEHWAIVTENHGNSSQLYWNELQGMSDILRSKKKNRAENVVTNLLGSFVRPLFYYGQFFLQFLNSCA